MTHRTMSERSYHGMSWRNQGEVHHEGSIRRPIAPWANALTTEWVEGIRERFNLNNRYPLLRHFSPQRKNEGRIKSFDDALNSFYLRLYAVGHMVNDRHYMGYSSRLAARAILYEPSHKHDSTCQILCYTKRGPLAWRRNRSMGWMKEIHVLINDALNTF